MKGHISVNHLINMWCYFDEMTHGGTISSFAVSEAGTPTSVPSLKGEKIRRFTLIATFPFPTRSWALGKYSAGRLGGYRLPSGFFRLRMRQSLIVARRDHS